MAEAHNAAALSLHLTHDGVSVSYDQELLRDIWHAFVRSYKRRLGRFKNDFTTGIFPFSAKSLFFTVMLILGFSLIRVDVSWGFIPWIHAHLLHYILGDGIISRSITTSFCGVVIWFFAIQIIRVSLKMLLSYKGWMYESPHEGRISRMTRLWLVTLWFIGRSEPMLHSFQGALPHLPLPSLKDTLEKHLESMRAVYDDKEYNEVVVLSEKFYKGIGRRLQRYLNIKYWLSINYVTDWWEEFVYLRQRTPIMINANYYGLDTLYDHGSSKQAAKAANATWAAVQFRRIIERQEITPFSLSRSYMVPFCTMQYERIFNTCRIPHEETDELKHWSDSKYVVVYHKGCWFKLLTHTGKRRLEPAELQKSFQYILDRTPDPAPGEADLAALTAGEREPWALARKNYFSRGVNKTSLHTIEKAAFAIILDEEVVGYDENDPTKLDHWACTMLHGNGNNRWFDKSFNMCVSKNGKIGINAEHSWGDAAVVAHLMEYVIVKSNYERGFTSEGDCTGRADANLTPTRLRWDLDADCQEQIAVSFKVAKNLIDDVEMALLVWQDYGKGFIKKLKVSPDAFVQMAIQLTYFRNQGRFCLTYEASMTRLYREGRTETVRSCSVPSCDFVRSMIDPTVTSQKEEPQVPTEEIKSWIESQSSKETASPSKSRETAAMKESQWEERHLLLDEACRYHQNSYRDAMCGKGIDRHMFALYVVARYLEEESPFLDKVFPPTYTLSTSQTPLHQTDMVDLNKHTEFVTAGGGFGPVCDKGYGVSYIAVGDHTIAFHISSKRSSQTTSSYTFREDLLQTLQEMRHLLDRSCSSPNSQSESDTPVKDEIIKEE